MKSWCINPNWHELREQEKHYSLAPRRSTFYKTQWAWQGVKFTSKKVWKFFDKISADKIWSKKGKGVESALLDAN